MSSNDNVDSTCLSNKIIYLNDTYYVDRLDDSSLKKEEIKVLKEISKKLDYIIYRIENKL